MYVVRYKRDINRHYY